MKVIVSGKQMNIGEAETAHPAFDQALERIAKRLRDHHRKKKSAAEHNPVNVQRYVITPPLDDGEEGSYEVVGDNTVIIAETTGEIETLPFGEAVMRMDLADRAAYVFRNSGNGRVNMVDCRRDRNIGWADREVSCDAAGPAEGQRWKS